MIVESYYWVRAAFIIWPKYFQAEGKDEDGDVQIIEEIIQLVLALIVMIGLAYSYFGKRVDHTFVKWLLVV